MRTCTRLVGLGVIALLLLAGPHQVRAQPSEDGQGSGASASSSQGDGADGGEDGGGGGEPATASRAMASLGTAPNAANEVQLVVRSFGVGNKARAGEWIGVEVELTDSSDKPRNVLVRIACEDIDNDTIWMQRTVVTNPGARQLVWLYMRLPFRARTGAEYPITAYEAEEVADSGQAPGGAGGGGANSGVQYRAQRLLGALRFRLQTDPVGPTTGLFAVVGTRGGGLEQFGRTVPPQGIGGAPGRESITGHEVIEVVGGLTPQTLPDRWMGLSQFEVVGWTGTGTADQPSQLREGQAEAIREWVKRGGHLCIVLPPVAQPWIGSPSNPLADIMPLVRVDRAEGVDLARYRSLLTLSPGVTMPRDAVVHTFVPENAGPYEAMPIMAGPDGECVVVRRIVGSGAVTVVGIDLTSRKLSDVDNALRADQFWNRVLGKRAPLFSAAEWQELRKSKGMNAQPYYASVRPVSVDAPIGAAIASNAKAAAGVLLAFVVFLAYWLIAGPLGYMLLKSRGKKQHAWLAFVGASAVFTVVAWGGANLLKIRTVEGKHITFVDSVYGQSVHRARSWMSVFLPRYGEQRLSVAPGATAGDGWRNLIAPWDPTGTQGAGAFVAFTDTRGYAAEARSPDTIAVPARATTKQVQVDWAGALPANWGMIRPLADASVPVGEEVRLRERPEARGTSRQWALTGTLVHALPGPLKNVQVWLVEGQKPTHRINAAPKLFADVRAVALASTEWKPNEAMALDTLIEPGATDSGADKALSNPAGAYSQTGFAEASGIPADLFGEAVTLYSMLTPPDPAVTGWNQAQREATHGLDLSRWFTQPSLIVIGELEDAESPIPMTVDSMSADEVRGRIKGRTIVRWVYPLAARPIRSEALIAPMERADESDPLGDLKGKPE